MMWFSGLKSDGLAVLAYYNWLCEGVQGTKHQGVQIFSKPQADFPK